MTVNEDLLESYERSQTPVHRVYEPEQTVVVIGAGRRGKTKMNRRYPFVC